MSDQRVVGLAHSSPPKPEISPLIGVFPDAGVIRSEKMNLVIPEEIRQALYRKLKECPKGTNFCQYDFPVDLPENVCRSVHSYLIAYNYVVKRQKQGKSRWITITF